MTVQLNIRLEKKQKEKLSKLAKSSNQTITAYILEKTIFSEDKGKNERIDNASSSIDNNETRIDRKLAEKNIKIARYEERIQLLEKEKIFFLEQKNEEISRLESNTLHLKEQLDRKDEQIINLQKIIYNKDTKLLEISEKKFWWQFWK